MDSNEKQHTGVDLLKEIKEANNSFDGFGRDVAGEFLRVRQAKKQAVFSTEPSYNRCPTPTPTQPSTDDTQWRTSSADELLRLWHSVRPRDLNQ